MNFSSNGLSHMMMANGINNQKEVQLWLAKVKAPRRALRKAAARVAKAEELDN